MQKLASFCAVSAHELAKDQRQNFGDDITAVLRLARKRKFVAAEEKCIIEENELHRYLRRLMDSDIQRSSSITFCCSLLLAVVTSLHTHDCHYRHVGMYRFLSVCLCFL